MFGKSDKKRERQRYSRAHFRAQGALFSGAAYTPDHERLKNFTDESGPAPEPEELKHAAKYFGEYLTVAERLPNIAHVRIWPPAPNKLSICVTRLIGNKRVDDVRTYHFRNRRFKPMDVKPIPEIDKPLPLVNA